MSQSIEKILGTIAQERAVPGTRPGESEKVRYVSFDKAVNPSDVFEEVIWKIDPPLASSGGVGLPNFIVTLPDETPFYALKIHGDLLGWQNQIELGAKAKGVLSAKLESDRFVISDGRTYMLSECKIERG